MNKKGFTLIELLAVIVILAIILLITVPLTLGVVEWAKKESFRNSAYGLVKTTENYMNEQIYKNVGSFEPTNFIFPEAQGLRYKGQKPLGGEIKLNKNGKIDVAIFNETWCALKGYDEDRVRLVKGICEGYENGDNRTCPLGSMKLTLFYPDNSTNRQWRLSKPGEVRNNREYTWQDYEGSICVKLTEVENIWIKYDIEGATTIMPPKGELLIDISHKVMENPSNGLVTITYDSDSYDREYRVGDSRWLKYNEPFVISENTIIYARAKKDINIYNNKLELIGSTTTVGYDIYLVNNLGEKEPSSPQLLPPIIEAIPSGGDIPNIKITYPELINIEKKYKLNLGVAEEYNNTLTNLEWGTNIIAYYYTEDGTKSPEASFTLEKEPEKLDVDIIVIPEPSNDSNVKKVNVTIIYDERSTENLFKVNDGEFQSYNKSFTMEEDAIIYATAKNEVGNGEATKNISFKIDEIKPPVINSVVSSDKTKAIITITYDEEFGITKKYSINGGVLLDYTESFEVTENGTVIYAENSAVDGTVASSTYTVVLEDEDEEKINPPVINSVVSSDKTKATITIAYDEELGITKKYSINGGTLLDYIGSFEVYENGAVIYAENESADGTKASSTYTVVLEGESEDDEKIKPPVINSVVSSDKTKATITITYDEEFGITKKYSINGEVLLDYTGSFEVYENGTVIYAENEAVDGTKASSTYTVILEGEEEEKIKPPVINSVVSSDKTKATITIIYDEELGITKKYSINEGTLVNYAESFEVYENGTIIYAENESADGTKASSTYVVNGLNIEEELQAPKISGSLSADRSKMIINIIYDTKTNITKKYNVNGGSLINYIESFEVYENGTVIYAESRDVQNNIKSSSYTVTGIMKELDVEILVSPDTPTELITEATITINYDEEALTRQYQINGGAILNYAGPFKITEKSKIKAIATAPNAYGEATKEIKNFSDGLEEPKISYTKELKQGGEVAKVSITYDNKATIKKYSINDGPIKNYTGSFEVIENGTVIYAYSANELGEYANSSLVINDLKKFTYVEYGKYFVVKLTYPPLSINREYKYGTSSWKPYDQNKGFVLIKEQYKNEFIEGQAILLEDEKGEIHNYSGDWYIVNVNDFNLLQEEIYMRWDYDFENDPNYQGKNKLQIIAIPEETETTNVFVMVIPEAGSIYTEYSVNGGDYLLYTKPLNIKENNTTIRARSKMPDGNLTNIVSYTITNIINIPEQNDFNEAKGVNRPQLTTGMTPIKWDENNNEIETNENDADWYDYSAKKWANAKTKDGSYFVWIPRYAYKITNGYHTNIAGTIEVKFLKERTNETVDGTVVETSGYDVQNKNTSQHYFKHPAFTFNGEELGFWVAKFEPSVADQTDLCYTSASKSNCNKTTLVPKIIPNVKSWRHITVSNAFDVSLKMKLKADYGWKSNEVDTHMMKNDEWGAVTYLSKSIYGANAEVWANPTNDFTTGCAGTGPLVVVTTGCQHRYDTPNGVKASTTHNIYGVYDMSGGAWEHVSAYVNNGHVNLMTYGQSILNAEPKYKNIYEVGSTDTMPNNYEKNNNIYGDAVYETSSTGVSMTSWYGDYSYMPNSSTPWFHRGGSLSSSANTGVFFFLYTSGIVSSNGSFRPVVVPLA